MKRLQSLHYHEICQIDGSMTVPKLKALLNNKTNNYGFILEETNIILGYVIYEEAESIVVTHFFVDPICRRIGYGTDMFDHLLDLTINVGKSVIFTTVDEYNLPAQMFMKKLGFTGKINRTNKSLIDFKFCLPKVEEMLV